MNLYPFNKSIKISSLSEPLFSTKYLKTIFKTWLMNSKISQIQSETLTLLFLTRPKCRTPSIQLDFTKSIVNRLINLRPKKPIFLRKGPIRIRNNSSAQMSSHLFRKKYLIKTRNSKLNNALSNSLFLETNSNSLKIIQCRNSNRLSSKKI